MHDLVYVSADLQKVMLPRTETVKSYIFRKKIITFNESFVPLGEWKQHKKEPLAVV